MELVSCTRDSLSFSLSLSLSTRRTINESGPRCVVELAALQRTAVCTPDICACFIEHSFFSTMTKPMKVKWQCRNCTSYIYIYIYHDSLADSRKSLFFSFPVCWKFTRRRKCGEMVRIFLVDKNSFDSCFIDLYPRREWKSVRIRFVVSQVRLITRTSAATAAILLPLAEMLII